MIQTRENSTKNPVEGFGGFDHLEETCSSKQCEARDKITHQSSADEISLSALEGRIEFMGS